MNPWLTLFPAMLLFLIGASAAYSKPFREGQWYLSVYLAIGVLCSLLWVYATRRLEASQEVYQYSLVWDSCMFVAYYLAPLLFLGIIPNVSTVVGCLVICIGACITRIQG